MKSKSLKVNIGLNWYKTVRVIMNSTSVLGPYLEIYRFMAARKCHPIYGKVI